MPGRITRLLVVASLALPLVSCSSDSLAPEVGAPLIPLSVGTEWRYLVRDSAEIGEAHPSPPDRFTMRVVRDTTLGRERWARVEDAARLFEESLGGAMYLRNRSNGLYAWEPPSNDFPLPGGFDLTYLMYRYPARKGEPSTLFPPSYVTATDTLITVPAGSFRTVRYDDSNGYVTVFIAPRIGVVRKVAGLSRRIEPDGTVSGQWRMVYELEAYTSPP